MSVTKKIAIMKRFHQYTAVLVALALAAAGCAETYVEEYVPEAPVIESFAPSEVLSGEDTPVVVTGRHLHTVTTATIGGREVSILERVSNTQLILAATRDARSGAIELTNAVGKAQSEVLMTVNYPVPVIRAEELPAQVDMFGELTLRGHYLAVVRKVIVTPDGADKGREAEILSQDGAELVVRVPYVETSDARITLRYDEGDEEVETPLGEAPKIGVVRLTPVLDALSFGRLIVGRITTLTGSNLDQITAVKVAGESANIVSQSASVLRFMVPLVEGFAEGEGNTASLAIYYFDDFESYDVRETIPVTVLPFHIWEGITTYGQRGAVAQSFFSPETGKVYDNSAWRTEVDPHALETNQNKDYYKTHPVILQTSQVAADKYLATPPYFFFSGANAGTLAINSPANSYSQLRNFFVSTVFSGAANRVPGGEFDCIGTPVLRFRYLDPQNPTEAAMADKVRNMTLTRIDEEEFPVDMTAGTVGGVLLGSDAMGGLSTDKWAPAYAKGTDAEGFPADAVLLVLYYNENGSPKDANPVENIKRIGFVHITSVDFKVVASGSNNPPSGSAVHFNAYWQKSDYDYSKL